MPSRQKLGTRDASTGLIVQWEVNKMLEFNEKAWRRGARKAAAFLAGEIKKNLSKAQSPPASKPGQFPHIGRKGKPGKSKSFGQLRNSIQSGPSEKGARVGSTVLYAKFLELGTSKMEARPFISATFAENFEQVRRIVEQEIADAHNRTATGSKTQVGGGPLP